MFDATVLVAALALIGTIVTGYFNLKATKDAKQSEAERKANEQAQAEKHRADEAEKQLKAKELMETFDEIRDSVANVQANVEKVVLSVEDVRQHMERINITLGSRIQETEESCDKIVQLVTKLSQNYTTLSACQARTESRIQRLVDLEANNLQFTKDIGTIVHQLSVIILEVHPELAEAGSMRNVVEMIASSEKEFIDHVMNSSVSDIKKEQILSEMPSDITVHLK